MPIKSDPRRLPRRNHYQEGPGFLFVATQGGRPVGSLIGVTSAAAIRRRRGALHGSAHATLPCNHREEVRIRG